MSLKTRPICLRFSVLGLLLLFLQPALAQPDFSNADAILQRNQKLLGNKVVALVFKDGKVVYQKQLGEDFTAKTQAPVAAASQWFTAALVMMLVDDGKIKLDDPVVNYIPVLGKYMKSYITIRHCITHTSGLENVKNIGKLSQFKKAPSLEDVINEYASKEIGNNPGVEFNYGIIGPALAARVLEIVSKKSFDRLASDRLFRPLKMRASSFSDDNGYAPNPGYGARSSANDYMAFLTMLMNKGMFEGKRLLSENAIAEMQKAQYTDLPVRFTPKVTEGWHHGLGEWIQEADANGAATVISGAGFFGTWPYIDKCRNYAAIIFVSTILPEQKRDIMLQFKEAVDAQMGECK
jgi:CubicO group peptidase (beta-lactamase class C family)